MDGLKPYMRYTPTGGDQHTNSVVYGPNQCITELGGYEPISPVLEVDNAITAMLSSTGFSTVLLDPYNVYLNVGIAHGEYNVQLELLFEYDFVDWQRIRIENSKLAMRDMLKSDIFQNASLYYDPPPYTNPYGARTDPPRQGPYLNLHYDPSPSGLTAAQLARTYCYDYGLRTSLVVEKWVADFYISYPTTLSACVDPHNYPPPPNMSTAASPAMAHMLSEAAMIESTLYEAFCLIGGGCFLVSAADVAENTAYTDSICNSDGCVLVDNNTDRVPARYIQPYTVTFAEADVWHVFDNGVFNFQADISDPLSKHGPGFYTIVMYGYVDDGWQIVGSYTFLHDNES